MKARYAWLEVMRTYPQEEVVQAGGQRHTAHQVQKRIERGKIAAARQNDRHQSSPAGSMSCLPQHRRRDIDLRMVKGRPPPPTSA